MSTWKNPFTAPLPSNPFAPTAPAPAAPPNPFAPTAPGAVPPGWSSTPVSSLAAVQVVTDHPAWSGVREPSEADLEVEERAKRRKARRSRSKFDPGVVADARASRAKQAVDALDRVATDEIAAAGEVLVELQHSADTDTARLRAARELVRIVQSEQYLKVGSWARELVGRPARIAYAELGRRLADGDISIAGAEALRRILADRAALSEVEALENRIATLQRALDRTLNRVM